MKTDELNNRHLIADEGKVLCRISDGWIAGREIYLGYTYYLGSEKLTEPLLELPEHYEEIDDPEEAEIVLLDEESELVEYEEVTDDLLTGPVVTDPPRVTLADYRRLEDKVTKMMELLGITE